LHITGKFALVIVVSAMTQKAIAAHGFYSDGLIGILFAVLLRVR
jgi:hypothetical protein